MVWCHFFLISVMVSFVSSQFFFAVTKCPLQCCSPTNWEYYCVIIVSVNPIQNRHKKCDTGLKIRKCYKEIKKLTRKNMDEIKKKEKSGDCGAHGMGEKLLWRTFGNYTIHTSLSCAFLYFSPTHFFRFAIKSKING